MGWKTHQQLIGLEVPPIPGAACGVYGGQPLFYGSTEYIGLGFSVLSFLIVIECFGSVFMKNCNVVIALLFGYMVAGLSEKNGDPYVNVDNIKNADALSFVWTETFPFGFMVLPSSPCSLPTLLRLLKLWET